MNVKDKVVVITGASSGIGEAAALLLTELGAKVVLGARGIHRLADLARRITERGGEVAYLPTNVKRQAEVNSLVALACERFGRLDVMINNAGVSPLSALDDLRVSDWEDMVDVNIKGVLYGIGAALPVFRRQNSGHFVNIASTAAYKTVPNQTVYSATKAAVRTLSEGLRQEMGSSVRVTVISPGFTRTNLAESVTNPQIKQQIAAGMNTMAIPPAAIARAIVFAIEQPDDVDVNEVIIRPTAQG